MILAAGRGTRMRELSDLRAKPGVPVLGVPVIELLLHWLRRHGVSEVAMNLHHRASELRAIAEAAAPPGLRIVFSHEVALLGTGGGLSRMAAFLRESDPCLILAGDMLIDADLSELVARHRAESNLATLLLREDARAHTMGGIGIDAEGSVTRVGHRTPSNARFDRGGETRAGVFTSVRCLAARSFDSLPERSDFEDLRDWLFPLAAAGERGIRAHLASHAHSLWEPVGTPAEYLAVNLAPPKLSYFDLTDVSRARGVRIEGDVILGRDAEVEPGAKLSQCVVWDAERVPRHCVASRGVFAGGRFISCDPVASPTRSPEE